MTSYLRDQHGVDWPITGHWCSTCGWPLTPICHGQDQHLQCEADVYKPALEVDRDATADAAFELTRQLGARPLQPNEEGEQT